RDARVEIRDVGTVAIELQPDRVEDVRLREADADGHVPGRLARRATQRRKRRRPIAVAVTVVHAEADVQSLSSLPAASTEAAAATTALASSTLSSLSLRVLS